MVFIAFIIFFVLLLFVYKYVVKKFSVVVIDSKSTLKSAHRNNGYFATYVMLWSIVPAIIILLLGYFLSSNIVSMVIESNLGDKYNEFEKEIINATVISVAQEINSLGTLPSFVNIPSYISKQLIIDLANLYNYYVFIIKIAVFIISALTTVLISYVFVRNINIKVDFQKKIESLIKIVLFIFASFAILTTIGIVVSLLFETVLFFQKVSVIHFLFGVDWSPEADSSDEKITQGFGIVPLILGTMLITTIAIIVAIIVGVSSAIYMAEYMSKRTRKIVKPILEILAGIPSIVYGFFAAITFAPFVVKVFATLGIVVPFENALVAGIIIGIMIIPFISSITDDVLHAIPSSIREGAMGMGSMKNEMIRKVLLQAAAPGIIGSILLAVSRAIGETIIVVMASSLAANLTFNPLSPVTTITTQIVMLVQGDQEFNSAKTLSAFALGFVLFVLTLVLNIIALRIVNKYKKIYG